EPAIARLDKLVNIALERARRFPPLRFGRRSTIGIRRGRRCERTVHSYDGCHEPLPVWSAIQVAAATTPTAEGHAHEIPPREEALLMPDRRPDDAASHRKWHYAMIGMCANKVTCGNKTARCREVVISDLFVLSRRL